MRIIIHLDLDAFFAAVEERQHPELKGRPLVVGADPKKGKGRGVVSTCNYEARRYGLYSGMPIAIAYRKCSHAVFLPVNFELYEKASKKIMAIVKKYAEKTEQWGIDEIFLDVSDKVKSFDEAKKLALKIKEEIKQKEKLTCSIGIGPNKLTAKIASDYRKPDGLTVIKPEQVKKWLAPQSTRKLWGIGPKTELYLHDLGIHTIGQLASYPVKKLKEEFGLRWGQEVHELALGIDESPVQESYEIKSIGRQHTFERDTKNRKLLFETLQKQLDDVWADLIENKFKSRTVTIKVRYEDFETHTKAKTLKKSLKSKKEASRIAKQSLLPFLESKKKIRLVGISLSSLIKPKRKSRK